MWLNAPANHGLARTGKPPQLVNMFPHYLAMSEIPKESTHHICAIHQNVILMVQAAETDKMYKDLMDTNVCSHDSKECMVHCCDVMILHVRSIAHQPKMIEELQIKHFTELYRKYTGIQFSFEFFFGLVDFTLNYSTTLRNFPLTNLQKSVQIKSKCKCK